MVELFRRRELLELDEVALAACDDARVVLVRQLPDESQPVCAATEAACAHVTRPRMSPLRA